MIDYLIDILRSTPVLALFLTLGLGFFIGKIRIGNFSLGSVTSVLLVGVVIGQLEIPLPSALKTVFFMLFLFSIGYNVGPDFFKSLRGSGARQALFAVIMSGCCFGITLLLSWWFGYSKGETVGLFSGSQTCSSLLGVGSDAISRLGLPEAELKSELNIIPVCYAVTYIFGTLGTVILLGNFGPKLLGGIDKVRQQTADLEARLHSSVGEKDPATVNSMPATAYRAYIVRNRFLRVPRARDVIESWLRDMGLDLYVDRVMHHDKVYIPKYDDLIYPGDSIVVCGMREYIIELSDTIGPETFEPALLSYSLDRVGVVVAKRDFTDVPLSTLRERKYMHGVVIRDGKRNGKPLPIDGDTVFRRGDRLTVLGRPEQVENATAHMGHVDRPSFKTDLMFVGLAIFIGGLFGAMTVWIGNVPLSFGTSGGSLLAGLIFGWLRSKRPTFGNISPGALWILNNLGLNVFIAVVGLDAAPSFVSGLKAVGPMLFVAGAIGTLIPLLLGLWMGHRLFKFNPAITLGCCCGTRTCTAALGAVQTALGSSLPAIGYTVTYAVSNILLVIWGLVTVLIV